MNIGRGMVQALILLAKAKARDEIDPQQFSNSEELRADFITARDELFKYIEGLENENTKFRRKI